MNIYVSNGGFATSLISQTERTITYEGSLRAGYVYKISATGVDGSGGTLVNPTLTAIGSTGATGSANDDYNGTHDSTINLYVPTAGTYLFQVSSADASAYGSVTLTLSSPMPLNAPTGTGGNDLMTGGTGYDSLVGGLGADTLSGNYGDDSLYGGAGNDVLYGNFGSDFLYGEAGIDTLFGGQGGDTLYGGDAGDEMYGNMATDIMFGGTGNDTLFGGQGDDVVYGDDPESDPVGHDVLAGNLGNDTLNGGRGDDVLTGGAGSDTFVFKPGFASDMVMDFRASEGDRIMLADRVGYTIGSSATGDAVIDLGGDMLTLKGITASQVSADWFVYG